jgi:hypothetical protein
MPGHRLVVMADEVLDDAGRDAGFFHEACGGMSEGVE